MKVFVSQHRFLATTLFRAMLFSMVGLAIGIYSADVMAHVKWFAPYDLTAAPRPAFSFFSNSYFVAIFLALVPFMMVVGFVDNYLLHRAPRLNALMERSHVWVESQFFRMMQVSVLAFFTAIFCYGNILLTPELNVSASDRDWVEWLQFAIAVAVISRHTAFLSAIGIFILYGIAAYRYGVFHLLDYPIFLGVATYIFIVSVWGDRKVKLANNILRIFTGVTLMWASIEKFAYPEWSFPILKENAGLSFGFGPELYMVAAGFVEFVAAFLLIAGAAASRAAAAVLLVFFVLAIPVFGIVDAIGHAVIIVVLIWLIFSQNTISMPNWFAQERHTRYATMHLATFYAALAITTLVFYGGHWLAYGV